MARALPGTSVTWLDALLRLSVAGLITLAIGGCGLLLCAPELLAF